MVLPLWTLGTRPFECLDEVLLLDGAFRYCAHAIQDDRVSRQELCESQAFEEACDN